MDALSPPTTDATATPIAAPARTPPGTATDPAPLGSLTAIPRTTWLAFAVLCLATLMNVLDTTIANLALTPIQQDLGFSNAGLAWVINAYMLTFGGFLLLAGRMGDLYGPRKLFLVGLTVFTLASLACGVAQSQAVLIVARAVQGLGAAVITAVSLALIFELFPDGPGRVKAMGIFAFVASGGGALGAVLGGYITANFDWHWNFLINVPIGIAVYFGTRALVPDKKGVKSGKLDVAGAVTVTTALLLAVYAVIEAKDLGWTSATTLLRLAGALALLAVFVAIERKAATPLVPLALFTKRSIVASNAIGILWAAAMFAWFFLSSLYMQTILGYDPQQAGFAFVPADVIMAAFSVGLSARVVHRFGIRHPVAAGLALAATGLVLFSMAPSDVAAPDPDATGWTAYVPPTIVHVLPGMLLLGIGAGMAFNPLFLAAMADAKPEEGGLASGLVNTSFMMGGALGLAVLASLAAAATADAGGAAAQATAAGALDQAGKDALNAGYRLAFQAGAGAAFLAALVAFLLPLRPKGDGGHAPVGH